MGPDLPRRLAVARGDEPADLVIRGGNVLSVFTREWLTADVAVVDGWIAGLGEYEGRETLDASGRWVVPGFIDAHLHLESPKLLPDEFARLVLPLGTTTVVADPHEIANVLGADGVHWLVDFCAELPLDVYFMAPSCVPASPFESPRSPLTDADLESLMARDRVLGLGEMMNFPGVVSGDARELSKLGLRGAGHVDGHAPSLAGRRLAEFARPEVPEWVQQSVRIAPLASDAFAVPECDRVRAIGLVPDQVVTESLVVDRNAPGLAKIAVVERHHATGRIGLGFVQGSGMQRGALASTVAHDAHNIVVLGASDDDMRVAVEAVVALGGGIVAVDGGSIVAQCPLPVAGLFSLATLDEVIAQTRACTDAAHAMGWSGATPFLTLSFLGLSVIPSLKITDQGLVDVERFELVPLCC